MYGTKKARSMCCHECWQRDQKHEKHAGPNGFARYCDAGDGDPIEIDDAFLEGPAGNCPLDKWAGLDPIGPEDPNEWEQWNRERNRERMRRNKKPGLKRAVRDVARNGDIRADAETALAVLVAAGRVPGWLADEIKSELGTAT